MPVNRSSIDLDIAGAPIIAAPDTPLILDSSGSLYSIDASPIVLLGGHARGLINGSVFAENGTGISLDAMRR